MPSLFGSSKYECGILVFDQQEEALHWAFAIKLQETHERQPYRLMHLKGRYESAAGFRVEYHRTFDRKLAKTPSKFFQLGELKKSRMIDLQWYQGDIPNKNLDPLDEDEIELLASRVPLPNRTEVTMSPPSWMGPKERIAYLEWQSLTPDQRWVTRLVQNLVESKDLPSSALDRISIIPRSATKHDSSKPSCP